MDCLFIILQMKKPRLRELLESDTKAHVTDYYIKWGIQFFLTQ